MVRHEQWVDQIVFRWDAGNTLGTTGFGPVAWSCDRETAEEFFRRAAALLRSTAAETVPALIRLEQGGQAMLVHRSPWPDPEGRRSSTVCHALLGPPGILDADLCLGLGRWSWAGSGLPLGDVRGGLEAVHQSALRPSAEDGQRTLRAGLPDVAETLTAVAAEFLRDPAQGFTVLDRAGGDSARRVLWGLHGLFSGVRPGGWTFATHDTAEDPAIRFLFVRSWPGTVSQGTDRIRMDPRERLGDRAERVAAELVDHYLRRVEEGEGHEYEVAKALAGAGSGRVLLGSAERALTALSRPPGGGRRAAAGPRDSYGAGAGFREGDGVFGPGGPRPPQERDDPHDQYREQEFPPDPAGAGPTGPGTVRTEPAGPGAARPGPADPRVPGPPGLVVPGTVVPGAVERGTAEQGAAEPGSTWADPRRRDRSDGAERGGERTLQPEPVRRASAAPGSAGRETAAPDSERREPERREPERRDPERRDPERRDPARTKPPVPERPMPLRPGSEPFAPGTHGSEPPVHAPSARPSESGTVAAGGFAGLPRVRPEWPAEPTPGRLIPRLRKRKRTVGYPELLTALRTMEESPTGRRQAVDAAAGTADRHLITALRQEHIPYAAVGLLVREIAGRYSEWGRTPQRELCDTVLDMGLFVTSRPRPSAGPPPADETRAANAAALYHWAVRPLARDARISSRLAAVLPRLALGADLAGRAAVDRILEHKHGPGLGDAVWLALLRTARQDRAVRKHPAPAPCRWPYPAPLGHPPRRRPTSPPHGTADPSGSANPGRPLPRRAPCSPALSSGTAGTATG
ncbi:hypothetical protein DMH02_009070 [Streptomyces sp. WAC 00631]|uniref:hypothetical protein n=1 Tax=Streptomyces sp. WAC 00631 TaxID=2203201 RepID=UPI001E4C7DB1|nr:hypothetical protein [Streptomyces sp. WAC 00631]MCC5033363.1 hypothetical protein [Streptomyces sp. WAC 00631]